MSAHVSIFPESLKIEPATPPYFRWPVIIRDEMGNQIHLTNTLADQLSQMLADRPKTTEKAA